MTRQHHYAAHIAWTGNQGSGTSEYRAYSRNHEITADGKQAVIPGSSDPAFRGDASRYNPEELLLSSVSACHMLWVLHLCADAGIVVTAYEDHPTAMLHENGDGSGEIVEITLRPHVRIVEQNRKQDAIALHAAAHGKCPLARSLRCTMRHEVTITVE